MFAIGIDLLMRRAIITALGKPRSSGNRARNGRRIRIGCSWPSSPRGGRRARTPPSAKRLEWIEALDAPSLAVPLQASATLRRSPAMCR